MIGVTPFGMTVRKEKQKGIDFRKRIWATAIDRGEHIISIRMGKHI